MYIGNVFGAVKVHTDDGADNTWLTSDDDTNGDVSQYGNPYRFTGRRYDDETGLYYCRARMWVRISRRNGRLRALWRGG